MKKHALNILLYCFIVILPTISGSYFLAQNEEEKRKAEAISQANWTATIHQSQWDQFISETVSSLQTLSLTSTIIQDNPWQLKPLLQKTAETDPRYGGLYLLNSSGRLLTGSNDLSLDRLYQTDYIQEVINTKDLIIANEVSSLNNELRVIGLASPVLSDTGELRYIMVALLRVDYIENIMKMLTPDMPIMILNNQNNVLINFTDSNESLTDGEWITHPINRLPWQIQVKVVDTENEKGTPYLALMIILFFILTHILFLFVKYVMLRRQTVREKKQNEIQKLELVGTLAASTAHEIRNPLTGIKGLVQLLNEKYTSEQDQFYFSVINDEINRINEIVSEFLILGRPTALKTEVVDFRKILQEVHPLIASEANLYNVTLHSSMPSDPVWIECTADQVKQVILNITKNAFEAMTTEGRLDIVLSCEHSRCILEVSDTGVGVGIKKEDLDKIFNPFYTSKSDGTGLGLVVCKRIVQSFNGEIFITSSKGQGTTVTIDFPVRARREG